MEKTKLMEESMKKLNEEIRRSDELLAQMIPKQVADKVKAGINPMETCEVNILASTVHRRYEKWEKCASSNREPSDDFPNQEKYQY